MPFSPRLFVKQFDLFSKPFVFFVGDKKSKSTLIGGALSLTIICVSLVYFYYLMNLYLSNKIEPKITQSIEIETNRNTISIAENFFFFEMLINGEPLHLIEEREGKKYLTMAAYYEKYNQTGTESYKQIPIVSCTDSNFKGFLCMDDTSIAGDDIYNEPINKISSDFALSVMPCDTTIESNCATPEEIYSKIFQSTNYFSVFTKIKQYNTAERRFKDVYKSEYFYFDPNSIAYTRMSLIKATTSVVTGLLFQFEETLESIFDFKRIDTFLSQENLYDRMGISGYAYLVFELNQVRNVIVIQHAMITEVLAQFMSIFNSLLTIGIIARMLAESHIVEDMNNILLKEYYKKTAVMLVKRRKDRIDLEEKKQQSNKKPTDKLNRFDMKRLATLDINDAKKSLLMKLKSPFARLTTNAIVSCSKKITECEFADKQAEFFKISLFDQFKIFVCQTFGIQYSKNVLGEKVDSDSAIYKNLLKQSAKRINIFELYKDIIRIKMAIKLILTKDQFAAIQFCGSEIKPEDVDSIEEAKPRTRESNLSNPMIQIIPEKPQQQQQLFPSTVQTPNSLESQIALEQALKRLSAGEKPLKETVMSTRDLHSPSEQGTLLNRKEFNQQQKQLQQQYHSPNSMQKDKRRTLTELQIKLRSSPKIPSISAEEIKSCKKIKSSSELRTNLKNKSLETQQPFTEFKQIYQDPSSRMQNLIVKGDCMQEESSLSLDIIRNSVSNNTIEEQPADHHSKNGGQITSLLESAKKGQQSAQLRSNNQIEVIDDNQIDIEVEGDGDEDEQTSELDFYQICSHLSEMDKIEEDKDMQAKFLKVFLEKIKQDDSLSHIDQQIYQSLIVDSNESEKTEQNHLIYR